ncbi:hypothetical protein SAMN05192553_1066 [Cyclobacterium xiamenense]|uniref:Uncharacterized protein n=1 Tax=Cyclobacterium xiamenense TaxID=1297121 RepID=A0A1H7AF40_9BACT|nr:hypothetical protein SAMN05192553_1066 [Cyclobacterium xiamenense]
MSTFTPPQYLNRPRFILFLVLASIFVEDLIGQTVNISGPTTVCPNNFHPSGNPNLNGHNYMINRKNRCVQQNQDREK